MGSHSNSGIPNCSDSSFMWDSHYKIPLLLFYNSKMECHFSSYKLLGGKLPNHHWGGPAAQLVSPSSLRPSLHIDLCGAGRPVISYVIQKYNEWPNTSHKYLQHLTTLFIQCICNPNYSQLQHVTTHEWPLP